MVDERDIEDPEAVLRRTRRRDTRHASGVESTSGLRGSAFADVASGMLVNMLEFALSFRRCLR